ncbi:UNVERIFIED_CONTAM: hypothetical protein HDU68_004363 [Siphonaria sp. JEL0065]|nr:hypothetical protein HDU68_004363 [Siphonaria sp. JEL0065]
MDDLFIHSCQFLTTEEVLRASFVFPVLVPFRRAAFRIGQLLGKRVNDVFPIVEVEGEGVEGEAEKLRTVALALATMRRFGLCLAPRLVVVVSASKINSGARDDPWAPLTDFDLVLPTGILNCPDPKIPAVPARLTIVSDRSKTTNSHIYSYNTATHTKDYTYATNLNMLLAESLNSSCLTHLTLSNLGLCMLHTQATRFAAILDNHLPKLQHLDLSHNRLDNGAGVAICYARVFERSLVYFDLSFNNVTHGLLPLVGKVVSLARFLRVLRMAGIRETVDENTNHPNAYSVATHHDSIFDNYVAFANGLALCPSLIELDIHQTFPRLGAAVNCILPQTNIKRLHLSQTTLIPLGSRGTISARDSNQPSLVHASLERLFLRLDPNFTGLTHLWLSANTLSWDSLQSLSQCLDSTAAISLTHLYLDATSLNDASFTTFIVPNLKNLPKLHTFSATHNKLSNASLSLLSETLLATQSCPKLTVLTLSQNQFHGHEAGIHFATILLSTPSLAEFHVSYMPLSDSGVHAIAQALPHTRIHTLGLEMCGFGDGGCMSLAAVLPLTESLRVLKLKENFLGDGEGVCALLGCKGVRWLEVLELQGCFLGVAGCVALAEGLSCGGLSSPSRPRIKRLELSRNSFKDLGVQVLAPVLRSLHGLKEVGFKRCELSEKVGRDLVEIVTTNRGIRRMKLELNPGLFIGVTNERNGTTTGAAAVWRDALGSLENIVLNRVK